MKRLIVSIGCIAGLVLSTNLAMAQGRGNGGPKVKTTSTAAPKAGGGSAAHGGGKALQAGAKTTGPRTTQAGGGAKAHGGGGAKAHASTTKTTGGSTKATASAKATGPKTKSSSTTTVETTTTSTTTKKGQTTVSTTEPLSAVQQKLQRNKNLASKLETRLEGKLPAGMTLIEAAEGFKSLGQFVSAVNATYNHDLDFDKLKIALLEDGTSLGQAMKEQRTALDSTTAATTAQTEADSLIKSTEPTTSTSTTTTTTTTNTSTTTSKVKPRASKDSRQ